MPVFVGYLAVIAALERPVGSMRVKLWQCLLLLVMIGSAIHIFTVDIAEGQHYFKAIAQAWKDGTAIRGSGVAGVLLGYPLEYFFTDTGAKIIICLLIFVFLMLVTGTTILTLFRTMWKPVKKTKESIESAMIAGAERRRAPAIDVELGEGYPEEIQPPVRSDRAPALEAGTEEDEVAEKIAALQKTAAELADTEKTSPRVEDLLPKKAAKQEEPAGESGGEPESEKKAEKKRPAYMDAEPDSYRYPPISLLDESKGVDTSLAASEEHTTADLLVNTLKEFGVSTRVIDVSHGPTVTRYELQPSAGVKISRITGLADDIALNLAASGVRIEAPIPGKAAVGIEVPNRKTSVVRLREVLSSPKFRNAKSGVTFALGKDIAGEVMTADIAKMPHLLIAGSTGSGKSVCINSMIVSLLYKSTSDDVKLLMIDPKVVELGVYNGIPHLLVPVVTDPRKAAGALGWAVTEMLRRYKLFAENNVRDIKGFNAAAQERDDLKPLPQIVIIIDELADLMMAAPNEVEDSICRLAQMARAAGMHLVIATQRPSVDVITGIIKANIPSRIAFAVSSQVDSRTILDGAGAEKLLGKGDMLFHPVGSAKPVRIQGCFVDDKEVERVVEFVKSAGAADYNEEIAEEIEKQATMTGQKKNGAGAGNGGGFDEDNDMLMKAVECVIDAGQASTSYLQRRLKLGYARAARLIDEMEEKGFVGPYEGSKPRQVLISRQQFLEMKVGQPDTEQEV